MIMIDTNVLIDLREAEGEWRDWSFGAVADARLAGPVGVSAVVIGELASGGGDWSDMSGLIGGFKLVVEPLDAAAACRAGTAHRAYRAAGGPRAKLLGDFLIGGHAEAAGAALITRDARRYRRYFPELTLITPENDDD
jgi:predicted nucleic acid-binding protein